MGILREIFRSMPLMIGIFEVIYGIIDDNLYSIYLGIGLFFNIYINIFLKSIIRYTFGENVITLRPKGAINCSNFNNCNNRLSTSMGMPSGHSQAMGFWTGYRLCKILETGNQYWENKKISIIFLFMISIITSCARLSGKYVGDISAYSPTGCHTPLQILVGYVNGFILGWYYYYIIVQSEAIWNRRLS